MMTDLLTAAQVAGAITGIVAALVLLIKPLRELVTNDKRNRDGIKCLLRSDMLHTYYKHHEDKTIRQYEYENFVQLYKAYKALKGNSFIDKIAEEVKEWEVVS